MRDRKHAADSTLHLVSKPSGLTAKQSVKVPPVSAEMRHIACDLLLSFLGLRHGERVDEV